MVIQKVRRNPPLRSHHQSNTKKRGIAQKKPPYTPRGAEYLYFTKPLKSNNIHQVDFLGPRYIKNDGRFYMFNVMNLSSHRLFIHPQRSKDDQAVALGLIRYWETVGIPDFLNVDNQSVFGGDNRHPHSFPVVLRPCLFHLARLFLVNQCGCWGC